MGPNGALEPRNKISKARRGPQLWSELILDQILTYFDILGSFFVIVFPLGPPGGPGGGVPREVFFMVLLRQLYRQSYDRGSGFTAPPPRVGSLKSEREQPAACSGLQQPAAACSSSSSLQLQLNILLHAGCRLQPAAARSNTSCRSNIMHGICIMRTICTIRRVTHIICM